MGGGTELVPDRAAVRAALDRLVERFEPGWAVGLDAGWVIEVGAHRAFTVRVARGRCTVFDGAVADVAAHLATDDRTWIDLVDGRVDGIEAFLSGRLAVTGDLNLAARFGTLFAPGPHSRRTVAGVETHVRGLRIESLVAGAGPPVVLLHGLGASKVSFLPTLHGLADRFEVHALDLPGFGRSAAPPPVGRRYSMAWLAVAVHGYLEAHGLAGAHLVGNSMGARVALEVALRRPESVGSVTGLGAALAFDEYRRIAPLLRWSRPHWVGVAPVPVPGSWVEAVVRDLFHDPSCLPAANLKAAADDAVAALRSPARRLALLACARHLAAERSGGRRGYWQRLAALEVPSHWVFGDGDRLVDHRYAERIVTALPHAEVEVWPDVGHVPQFEAPDRTNATLAAWIEQADRARTG